MERLQKLIKSRAVNLDPPSHFDKSNVDSIFGMMDPTKKGVITLEQYKAGTIQITFFKEELQLSSKIGFSSPVSSIRIARECFVYLVLFHLKTAPIYICITV